MESTSAALARLKDQLAQVDTLIRDGVLTGGAARETRDELERQILALVTGVGAGASQAAVDPLPPSTPVPAAATATPLPAAPTTAATAQPLPAEPRPSRRLTAGVIAFVVFFGGGAYALLGHHAGWNVGPGEAGPASAQEAGAGQAPSDEQVNAMIAQLADRLKTKPDDADGWAMLGRSYTALGRYAEALPAYKKVVELRPRQAQALADYADGLAMVNQRSLDGEPARLVLEALRLDPANVKALALAGTVAFNHAEYTAAVGYWDRAVQASGPDSELSRQLKGAIDEAHRRAGAAASSPLSSPLAGGANSNSAAADAASPAQPSALAGARPEADAPPSPGAAPGPIAAAGATIAGRVTLRADLRAKVPPDATVFIFARAPGGPRMPLAILRKKASDLPLDFSLDDSLAMSPAARLSSSPQVVVGARISLSGNALPAPGDWQAISAPVALGTKDLRLEIGEPVR